MKRQRDREEKLERATFPFGVSSRVRIARNSTTHILFLAVSVLIENGVLEGSRTRTDRMEWLNAGIKGHKLEIQWGCLTRDYDEWAWHGVFQPRSVQLIEYPMSATNNDSGRIRRASVGQSMNVIIEAECGTQLQVFFFISIDQASRSIIPGPQSRPQPTPSNASIPQATKKKDK